MKPGDIVYAVLEGFSKLRVESAAVEKITREYVYLKNPGLAFNCRRQHSKQSGRFHSTPRAALLSYIEKELRQRDYHDSCASEARELLKKESE